MNDKPTEEERYSAYLKQQVQEALEASQRQVKEQREKADLWLVWEWIKQYGGDINLSSTTIHLILLGVRHLYSYWWKDFKSIHLAAEWIREQEAQR
jgi:hypothetical protein